MLPAAGGSHGEERVHASRCLGLRRGDALGTRELLAQMAGAGVGAGGVAPPAEAPQSCRHGLSGGSVLPKQERERRPPSV